MMKTIVKKSLKGKPALESTELISGIIKLLEEARRYSAKTVNSIMTATYWEIGRRIVYNEQKGKCRADYGEMIMKHLALELSDRFGKGFSLSNVKQMKKFHLVYPDIDTSSEAKKIKDTQKGQTVSGLFDGDALIPHVVLRWGVGK